MFIMFIDTEMHIFSFFSSSDFQNATSSVPAALSYLTSFLFFSHPLCKSFSIVCTELYLPFLIFFCNLSLIGGNFLMTDE